MMRFIIDTAIILLVAFLMWQNFNLHHKVSALTESRIPDVQRWLSRIENTENKLRSLNNEMGSARAYIAYFYDDRCITCKIPILNFDLAAAYSTDPNENLLSKRSQIPLRILPNAETIIQGNCTAGVLGIEDGARLWRDLPPRSFIHCPLENKRGMVVGLFGVSYNEILDSDKKLEKMTNLSLHTQTFNDLLFE